MYECIDPEVPISNVGVHVQSNDPQMKGDQVGDGYHMTASKQRMRCRRLLLLALSPLIMTKDASWCASV